MEQQPLLNEHNKQEHPPMHTVEHIINRTMVNLFGCGRAVSAHIERKKSKLDFALTSRPTDDQIIQMEKAVNEVIKRQLPVTIEFISYEEAKDKFNLSRLPDETSKIIRIIHVGEYDECPCIGAHVNNTSEIGCLKIISHDYNDGILRIRFKLIQEI